MREAWMVATWMLALSVLDYLFERHMYFMSVFGMSLVVTVNRFCNS